jgi:FixJ family two-component response regulator
MRIGSNDGVMHEGEATSALVVVDDDPVTRDVLAALFGSEGFQVRTYADGEAFLADAGTLRPACVLLDVHLPVRSGLDVLQAVGGADYPAPVIMISARGDIPIAVAAVKAGAYDFVEKPFDPKVLMQRVKEAVTAAQATANRPTAPVSSAWRMAGPKSLTARETEVLEQIVQGASSKEAGQRLGISQRTVETHRAQIMEKLGARNTADLIRIVLSGRKQS